jgi:ribosomal 50S subunit-associated protein YjgA (DUF615 family)
MTNYNVAKEMVIIAAQFTGKAIKDSAIGSAQETLVAVAYTAQATLAVAEKVDSVAVKVIAHADSKMEGFLAKSRAARARFNAATEAKYGYKVAA